MIKRIAILLFLLSAPLSNLVAQSPDTSHLTKIHFRLNSATVDSGYMDNGTALRALGEFLRFTPTSRIDSIAIYSASSPEGGATYNRTLAGRRATAMKGYLIWKYPQLNQYTIYKHSEATSWDEFSTLVEQNSAIPAREELIKIINSSASNKITQIRALANGATYRYLTTNIFPRLRQATTCIIYARATPPPPPPQPAAEPTPEEVIIEEVVVDEPIIEPAKTPEVVIETPLPSAPPQYWALKTNLLYDAALTPNIGAEVYLGREWSLSAEWAYAWWSKHSEFRYWRLYGGTLELRRWFGEAAEQKPLTGHHVGLYLMAGTYDIEFGGRGNLSKFSYAASLAYGYALPIGKRLNLDFGIALGYVRGEYESYVPMDTHCVWQATKMRNYFGPTKLDVSLVWLMGRGNINNIIKRR